MPEPAGTNHTRGARLPQLLAGLVLLLLVAGCGQEVGPDERVERARDHRTEGDHRAAIIELRNALRDQSDHAVARALLGRIYVEVGDMPAAEKELRRGIELGVPRAELVVPLGRALLEQRKHAELLNDIPVEDDWPANVRADVLGLHARALVARDDLADAQRSIERAESADADSLQAGLARVELALARGRADEALDVARALTESHAESSLAWRGLYRAATASNDLELAESAADRAIEFAAQPAEDRLFRARIRVARRDLEGARADLEVLESRLQGNPRVRFVNGLIAWAEQDYETACDQLQQAVSGAPAFVEARFYLGACLYRSGEHNQAESHLNWVEQRTSEPRVARLLALVRLDLGQAELAREVLRPLIERNPDDVVTLALLGRAEMQLGNTTEAIGHLQRLAELRPGDAATRLELGTGLLQTGQIDAGQQALDEALTLDPESGRAGAMLVISHLQDGDHDEALSVARRMTEEQPEKALPWTLVALVRMAQEDVAAAREALNEAIRREPADPAARHYLARLELQAGNSGAARSHFEAVLEEHAGDVQTLVALASLEARDGNVAEARDLLMQAHQADPDAMQPRLILARLRMEQGDAEGALEILGDEDGNVPNEPAALEIAGRAYMALDRTARAIGVLSRLVDRAPENAGAHLLLARAYARAGDSEATVRQIERVLEFEPDNARALMLLARVRTREGRDEEARALHERLPPEARDTAFVLRDRIALARRAGDTDRVVTLYRQLLEREPSGAVSAGLARALDRSGDPDGALAVLQEWIENHPDDTDTRLALGDLYAGDGREDKAITAYRQVLEAEPDSVRALNNLAWLLRERAPSEAMEHAERAVDLQPDSAAVRDTLGMVLLANDRPEDAVQQLRTAVELAPDEPALRYHYARGLAAVDRDDEAREHLRRALEAESEFEGREEAEALLDELR